MATKRELTDAEILAQFERAREADRLADVTEARARAAHYDPHTRRVVVELKNGAAYAFPAAWVRTLAAAAPEQLAAVELDPAGDGLRWDELDEDVSVSGMLGRVAGPSFVYRQFAAAGGRSRSEAKAAAARANGRKGGRPRKSYPEIMAGHRSSALLAREVPVDEPRPPLDETEPREKPRYDSPERSRRKPKDA